MLRLEESDNNNPNANVDSADGAGDGENKDADFDIAEPSFHEATPLTDNNNFVSNNDVVAPNDDSIAQKAIAKNPNADYRIELVPLSFDISKNLKQIQENTILLKKEKSGLIKGYLIRGGKFKGPFHNLGLTAAETKVLTFPGAGEEHVEIERDAFPELIDKVCMRCGIRSARSLLGTTLAVVFSFGCGVTTLAAFFKMLLAASVSLTPIVFVGAAVIGVSTFVANYRMSQFDLPELFLAGYKYLFKNRYNKDKDGKLMLDDNGNVIYEARNIPPLKMFLLGFGAVCSFFLGVAIAVLTYTATVNLATAFAFLAPFAPVLPIVGVILGGASLISLSLIMFKATSDLLKSDTLVESLNKIRDNLLRFDAKTEQDFLGQAYRVGALLLFGALSLVLVGLTFLGAVYIQIACVASINDTFNITNDLIKGFTATIVGGLALISQIPFVVKTTVNPILKFFYRWPEEPVAQANENQQQQVAENDPNDPGAAKGLAWYLDKTLSVFGTLASLMNAVSNGLIALNGQKPDFNFDGAGTVGAIANSFCSTLGNTLSDEIPEPIVDAKPAAPEGQQDANFPDGGSYKDIHDGLQKNLVNTNNKITPVEVLTSTGEDNNSFNEQLSDAPNNVVLFPAQKNGGKKPVDEPIETQENQTLMQCNT